ncbi:MAG: hypothetical protein V4663_10250 [Bacteroidota bacterium]
MKNFYTKSSILFALSVVLISSCKKKSDAVALEPNTWIESSNRKDTIIFKNDLLILNRPKEVRNGYLLPQLGDGLYSYKELKDSIFLHYTASSYYGTTNYAFKIENNTLYIGDFYNKSGKLLVFKKIK